jgi:hypothetical protein
VLGAIIDSPKWLEPRGFYSFEPAHAGTLGRMRIGGSSKIARTAEGKLCANRLFGSGSAGLGLGSFRVYRRTPCLVLDAPNGNPIPTGSITVAYAASHTGPK